MMFPSWKRDAQRFEEIGRVLFKYGLAEWMGDTLPRPLRSRLASADGQALTTQSREARIRLALTELGVTFAKLGQFLSTRPDLVGPALAEELTQLQAHIPADPPEVARARIEEELGMTLEECFGEIDLVPLASGSIGQVHAARLLDGRPVVVKVRHPGIEARILSDLDILDGLAHLAESQSSELRLFAPRALARQLRRRLTGELDLARERRNLETFRRHFRGDERVVFPEPVANLSTHGLLTMERIAGFSVREVARLRSEGHDPHALAARGASLCLKMILGRGFYHGDPHPGNIFVLGDGRVAFLDCATTARLDGRSRDAIEDLILAAQTRDTEQVADAVLLLGRRPARLDRAAFEEDLATYLEDFAGEALESWDFGRVLGDLAAIIRRHRILLPVSVSQLLHVLVVLQGTARQLSPRFSLGEAVRPWARRALGRRLSPQHLRHRMARSWRDWQRLFDAAPREIAELMERVRQGTLDVHLQHRGLDATFNRAIYGVLAASLILASSQLLSRNVPPTVFGLSLAGLLTAACGLALTLRLLWAIRRFGGLGRDEDRR